MRELKRKTARQQARLRLSAQAAHEISSRFTRSRPAFTLIEMLVVVSIILIITVAVVAVAPRFTDDRKLSRAADQLAQILLTVKQRSKRDLVPTGVRLFPNAQGLVTELQYIQQPDDFGPAGSMVTLTAIANNATIDAAVPASVLWPRGSGQLVMVAQGQLVPSPLDFTGGFANQALWPVQPGDYLNVKGAVHLILAVSPYVPGTPPTPSTLILAPVAPPQPAANVGAGAGNTLNLLNTAQISSGMSITGLWAGGTPTSINTIKSVNNTTINATTTLNITLNSAPGGGGDWLGFLPAYAVSPSPPTTYSIIRQPRVLQGETPLQLPAGICIDTNWPKFAGDIQDAILPVDPVTGSIDIMFSPQGNVLNVRGRDTMILWVRDSTKDVTYSPTGGWPPAGTPGDQFLIFLQTHTGFIAQHPVDTTPGFGPYTFTQDARSSGL